jgi:hypothetical protein
MLAGLGIFARNQLARRFGVAVAAVNLIAALTSIEVYPFWAVVIVGIDILVIYGLLAYGDRLDPAGQTGLSDEPHAQESSQANGTLDRSTIAALDEEQARSSRHWSPTKQSPAKGSTRFARAARRADGSAA